MAREYWITKEDGTRCGIKVDKFKKSVEDAISRNMKTKYSYDVYQICYKTGAWVLTMSSYYEPTRQHYKEKWYLRWYDDRMDYIIGIICEAFLRWIRTQEVIAGLKEEIDYDTGRL